VLEPVATIEVGAEIELALGTVSMAVAGRDDAELTGTELVTSVDVVGWTGMTIVAELDP